jgi:hypothetical protein
MSLDSAPIFGRMVPERRLEAVSPEAMTLKAVSLEAMTLEAVSLEAMSAIEAMTAS